MKDKKNLGSVVALYPTPVTVVGAMNGEKPTWLLVAHIGIVSHDEIMVSCAKNHYTNKYIKENRKLSVNIVDEKLLPKADYVGTVSGDKTDKSEVFEYELGEAGTPVIRAAPVTMECSVLDIYETAAFENFVLKVDNTYADDRVIGQNGKLNYEILKPVLFQMPTCQYLKTGEIIGKCRQLGDNAQ